MKIKLARTFFLFRLLFTGMLFLFLHRLLFFFLFKETLSGPGIGEYTKAFLIGELTDAIALIYFLLPMWLLLLFGSPDSKSIQRWSMFFFYFGFFLLCILNTADLGYFPITKKRMGSEILNMLPEVPHLIGSYAADYWYLFLLLILFVYAAGIFIGVQLKSPPVNEVKWKLNALNIVLSAFLFFTIMRGGYAKRPFSPFDIPNYVDPRLQWLACNTPFQFLHTLGHENFPVKKYFDSKEAERIANYQKFPLQQGFNKKNVLILILESFCSERLGWSNPAVKAYTPFMDSLLSVSRTYAFGMANGRMTIDALPSVLSGIPSFMEKNYCYSPYQSNSVKGIAGLLKPHGYSTTFFYGGLKNTFGFQNFIRLNFSERYISQEDFTREYENSGWGVDDHLFLPFVASHLDSMKQPFCASLLTLSLHHPFPIPPPYKALLDTIKDPVRKSMKYTDISLAQFFNTIRKQDWFRNSVIAICADHTSGGFGHFEGNEVNAFAIPVVFLVPGDSTFNVPQQTSASQIDIYPTLLDVLGYPGSFRSLGHSVLKEGSPTIQYAGNGIYQIFSYPYYLELDTQQDRVNKFAQMNDARKLQDKMKDASLKEIKQKLEDQLKATLQVYSERVNSNSL